MRLFNLITSNDIVEKEDGFSVTKFVLITCSISLLLFSLGYVLKPVSEIVVELNDSSDDEN